MKRLPMVIAALVLAVMSSSNVSAQNGPGCRLPMKQGTYGATCSGFVTPGPGATPIPATG